MLFFLSYADEDGDLAREIADRLGNEHVSVYASRDGTLPPGATTADPEHAIQRADAFVALLSPTPPPRRRAPGNASWRCTAGGQTRPPALERISSAYCRSEIRPIIRRAHCGANRGSTRRARRSDQPKQLTNPARLSPIKYPTSDPRSIMHPRADQADPSNAARWTWQFIVAVVLLVAFAALIAAMMLLANGGDTVWQRRVYVFGAAQAIVFTAIGWLFGREVNRSTVESAKSDAAQAKQEAASARHEATEKTLEAAEAEKVAAEEKTKGRAVKALVRNGQSTAAAGRAGGPRDVGVTPTAPSAAAVLADLGALVDELYGE
jgi:hypothetical protein